MKTQGKIDLYKVHKAEYAATRKPALIDIKPAQYLAVQGMGAPGGKDFQTKIGALYSMAFTIKMTKKFAGLQDYSVCKLEGLWWAGKDACDFSNVPPDKWQWKLIIRTPEFISQKDLDQAVETLMKRGKGDEVKGVKLETMSEGLCVQMLHVGPYEKEHESIALMRHLAETKGYEFHGLHHEIYLSDPRRVPPERLKTILRIPVKTLMKRGK